MIKKPNKNNPYYYEMKKISEEISECADCCKNVQQMISEYCVNDENSLNDFKEIRINTIKLCDNVSFLREEILGLTKGQNEILQRVEKFEKNHQRIMKDNQDLMQLINKNYNNFFFNNKINSNSSIAINKTKSRISSSTFLSQ